ncbi:MAG: tRNA 2-thiouridine(34) synthase MnmA [Eubacteriales bacterium]
MNQQKNIVIGMSGGVDSSVAALLLKQEGHTISGVTYTLFPHTDHNLQNDPNATDALAVAQKLGISHRTHNLSALFDEQVVAPFVHDYEQGRTPNPCYHCNSAIKFSLPVMDLLEAEGFATGHYAKITYDQGSGRYLLQQSPNKQKDQSYFLSKLTQAQLSRAHFPLANLSKDEVRAIAADHALPTALRTDSQDICFVPDGDYISFLRKRTAKTYQAGEFQTPAGTVLGKHKGIISYTVGQRRGLDISSDGRLYVKEIRPEQNTVILSDNQSLYSDTLIAHQLNFIATESLETPTQCRAKIRSRHDGEPATAQQIDTDTLQVTFLKPQRAITPGQVVVLYDGDTVIASGIIATA